MQGRRRRDATQPRPVAAHVPSPTPDPDPFPLVTNIIGHRQAAPTALLLELPQRNVLRFHSFQGTLYYCYCITGGATPAHTAHCLSTLLSSMLMLSGGPWHGG